MVSKKTPTQPIPQEEIARVVQNAFYAGFRNGYSAGAEVNAKAAPQAAETVSQALADLAAFQEKAEAGTTE